MSNEPELTQGQSKYPSLSGDSWSMPSPTHKAKVPMKRRFYRHAKSGLYDQPFTRCHALWTPSHLQCYILASLEPNCTSTCHSRIMSSRIMQHHTAPALCHTFMSCHTMPPLHHSTSFQSDIIPHRATPALYHTKPTSYHTTPLPHHTTRNTPCSSTTTVTLPPSQPHDHEKPVQNGRRSSGGGPRILSSKSYFRRRWEFRERGGWGWGGRRVWARRFLYLYPMHNV